jgi:hypothetical protein
MGFEKMMDKALKNRQYDSDYLSEFFVWWDDVTRKQLADFGEALKNAKRESDMQRYLETNPFILIQHLGGGNGRWVIPQKRLGSDFVPDFVIGERHSFGFHWQLVEIENPSAMVFTKNGDPSKTLNHAIRQITDWRSWLTRNQNYACRRREENGLGLIDIDNNVKGLIIVGRHASISPSTNDRRRQLCSTYNIDIHSYDWLVDTLRGRIEALEKCR